MQQRKQHTALVSTQNEEESRHFLLPPSLQKLYGGHQHLSPDERARAKQVDGYRTAIELY